MAIFRYVFAIIPEAENDVKLMAYPQEFLAFCGVLGQGTLLAQGNRSVLPTLRTAANDSAWRTGSEAQTPTCAGSWRKI